MSCRQRNRAVMLGMRINQMDSQVYRFKQVIDAGDEIDRLVIVEDNGDRCFVQSLVFCIDWPIRPTRLVRKDDIELCES